MELAGAGAVVVVSPAVSVFPVVSVLFFAAEHPTNTNAQASAPAAIRTGFFFIIVRLLYESDLLKNIGKYVESSQYE